jgi:hypothetical protein
VRAPSHVASERSERLRELGRRYEREEHA